MVFCVWIASKRQVFQISSIGARLRLLQLTSLPTLTLNCVKNVWWERRKINRKMHFYIIFFLFFLSFTSGNSSRAHKKKAHEYVFIYYCLAIHSVQLLRLININKAQRIKLFSVYFFLVTLGGDFWNVDVIFGLFFLDPKSSENVVIEVLH